MEIFPLKKVVNRLKKLGFAEGNEWDFGYSWLKCGLVLLPVSIVPLILVLNKGTDIIGTVGGIVCAVQLIPLIGSIFPTEAALKKTFDRNGIRR